MVMNPHEALAHAVEKAGGQAALGRLIGERQQKIFYWLNGSKRGAPAEAVLEIERVTGVSRHELRPDVYPAPAQEGEAA
jgi:DNA-binding transcriptional regulator YdaS (Cro superfamily)|tara:strand:+ start:167 stop:403 length:237 start_codon:yes stop_codon:yes gene_type:complete